MASLSDILVSIQNGVTAINDLGTTIKNTFLQTNTAVSTAAISAGTLTFSSSLAAGSLLLTTSSGASYKLILYPSS